MDNVKYNKEKIIEALSILDKILESLENSFNEIDKAEDYIFDIAEVKTESSNIKKDISNVITEIENKENSIVNMQAIVDKYIN